jgi:predicted RNA-binding protein with PUA-like domain
VKKPAAPPKRSGAAASRVVAPVPTDRRPGEVLCWLMKSEPEVFSFADLLKAPKRTTGWEGVRNYQARNYMRDGMRVGDLVLFYHSNAEPSGVAGIAEVARAAYPDPAQFDRKSEYFDPKATREAPIWMQVDLRAVEAFPRVVTLEMLKADPALAGMEVTRKGSRLSVQLVSRPHFDRVVALARR